MKTREEHLQWCKDRALEYVKRGDLENAVASMGSDLRKHPETEKINTSLVMLGALYVMQRDREGVRNWIKGFR